MPNVNNRTIGENSPNLVTLIVAQVVARATDDNAGNSSHSCKPQKCFVFAEESLDSPTKRKKLATSHVFVRLFAFLPNRTYICGTREINFRTKVSILCAVAIVDSNAPKYDGEITHN
jgi:hypothetical protein